MIEERSQEEKEFIRRQNRQFLRFNESFDKEFPGGVSIRLGGVPIYVDKEHRDDVIPKPTQTVAKFMNDLRELDRF